MPEQPDSSPLEERAPRSLGVGINMPGIILLGGVTVTLGAWWWKANQNDSVEPDTSERAHALCTVQDAARGRISCANVLAVNATLDGELQAHIRADIERLYALHGWNNENVVVDCGDGKWAGLHQAVEGVPMRDVLNEDLVGEIMEACEEATAHKPSAGGSAGGFSGLTGIDNHGSVFGSCALRDSLSDVERIEKALALAEEMHKDCQETFRNTLMDGSDAPKPEPKPKPKPKPPPTPAPAPQPTDQNVEVKEVTNGEGHKAIRTEITDADGNVIIIETDTVDGTTVIEGPDGTVFVDSSGNARDAFKDAYGNISVKGTDGVTEYTMSPGGSKLITLPDGRKYGSNKGQDGDFSIRQDDPFGRVQLRQDASDDLVELWIQANPLHCDTEDCQSCADFTQFYPELRGECAGNGTDFCAEFSEKADCCEDSLVAPLNPWLVIPNPQNDLVCVQHVSPALEASCTQKCGIASAVDNDDCESICEENASRGTMEHNIFESACPHMESEDCASVGGIDIPFDFGPSLGGEPPIPTALQKHWVEGPGTKQ